MWWSRRRDRAAYERVAAACRSAEWRGWSVGRVVRVYQHAHRGSKAVLAINGIVVDSWFWWYHVTPGSLVFVRTSSGWGPHSGRYGVHYVGEERGGHGILGVVPAREVRRADRHARRLAPVLLSVRSGHV